MLCPQTRPAVIPQGGCNPQELGQARLMAAQLAGMGGGCQNVFDQNVVTVIEPAVVTPPNIVNLHRRVEHIVPVITENVQQHHTHHEFVARPELMMRETFNGDITIREPLAATFAMTPQPFAQVAPAMMPQIQAVPTSIDVVEHFNVNAAQPVNFPNLAPQNFAQTPAIGQPIFTQNQVLNRPF